MSYQARNDIALKPHPLANLTPQAVFALDNGKLVAVAYSATPTPRTTLACAISAWWVDEDGNPQAIDADGDGEPDFPVLSQYRHSADVTQIAALGAQGIADALRELILGEPQTAIPVAEQLAAQVSIRNVIAVATASGEPIDITGG